MLLVSFRLFFSFLSYCLSSSNVHPCTVRSLAYTHQTIVVVLTHGFTFPLLFLLEPDSDFSFQQQILPSFLSPFLPSFLPYYVYLIPVYTHTDTDAVYIRTKKKKTTSRPFSLSVAISWTWRSVGGFGLSSYSVQAEEEEAEVASSVTPAAAAAAEREENERENYKQKSKYIRLASVRESGHCKCIDEPREEQATFSFSTDPIKCRLILIITIIGVKGKAR